MMRSSQSVKRRSCLGGQDRRETAITVSGQLDPYRTMLGQDCLVTDAVALVRLLGRLALAGRVTQVQVHLRIYRSLNDRLVKGQHQILVLASAHRPLEQFI